MNSNSHHERPHQRGCLTANSGPHFGDFANGKQRKKRAVATYLLLAIVVVAACALMVLGRLTAPDAVSSPGDTLANEEQASSTPKSEWQQGAVPHLYQIDPQWADEPYAGGDIRENGCGPTCLAMVYVALTGNTDYTPAEMARFSEKNGFVTDGLTAWALMTDGAALLGITGTEISTDPDQVRGALDTGHPIICSVRPGDFTTTGHFIVLAGLAENGEVIVHDPNSAERSKQTWDLERVLNQCANLWVFSA